MRAFNGTFCHYNIKTYEMWGPKLLDLKKLHLVTSWILLTWISRYHDNINIARFLKKYYVHIRISQYTNMHNIS